MTTVQYRTDKPNRNLIEIKYKRKKIFYSIGTFETVH